MTAACETFPFSKRRGLQLVKEWRRTFLRIFGVRLRMEDRNNGAYERPPYLFVLMNQTSLLDGVVLTTLSPIPVRFFFNIEFALVPFLSWGVLLQAE